jgi:hypothetical protein
MTDEDEFGGILKQIRKTKTEKNQIYNKLLELLNSDSPKISNSNLNLLIQISLSDMKLFPVEVITVLGVISSKEAVNNEISGIFQLIF